VPALTLPTKLAAFAYIITFVLGTVTAMGGYAAVIGARGPVIKRPPLRCATSVCCWHAALVGRGGAGAVRATRRQRAASGAPVCF